MQQAKNKENKFDLGARKRSTLISPAEEQGQPYRQPGEKIRSAARPKTWTPKIRIGFKALFCFLSLIGFFINPQQFFQDIMADDNAAAPAGDREIIETNYDDVVESFDLLNLKEDLLRGIYNYGFEKPSAIQQRGIKPILDKFDTIGQAQSGTGKTATFAIAALQIIDYNEFHCQSLILAPTRELAQQIQKVNRQQTN
eukprot:GHVT01013658.1.p2 GENE.GHVT01013658.1~~GHVT01013658.1.p2  ORF type:complete len:198 (+),score=25.55 GHVT01013658.1:1319-1912(+)